MVVVVVAAAASMAAAHVAPVVDTVEGEMVAMVVQELKQGSEV